MGRTRSRSPERAPKASLERGEGEREKSRKHKHKDSKREEKEAKEGKRDKEERRKRSRERENGHKRHRSPAKDARKEEGDVKAGKRSKRSGSRERGEAPAVKKEADAAGEEPKPAAAVKAEPEASGSKKEVIKEEEKKGADRVKEEKVKVKEEEKKKEGATDRVKEGRGREREEKEKDKDRERGKGKAEEKEKDRGREKERDRDRDWDRDRERHSRPGEPYVERESNREKAAREAAGRGKEEPSGGKGREEESKQSSRGENRRDGGAGKMLPPPPREPKKAPALVDPRVAEALLKQQQAASEAGAKPRFMSKKEREALAAKEKEAAEAELKRKADELARAHKSYVESATDRSRRREAEAREDEERRRRTQDRGRSAADREKEKVKEEIKKQYLGADKARKKVQRPSEKFRFNFDWEAGDDTSRDLNPLYNATHEAQLMFGSGMRAGIDRKLQAEEAETYKRKLKGEDVTPEVLARERQLRVEAANTAGKGDSHWSTKAREAMTERDWRIFREDFSIAYKGAGTGVLPIRNWEESGLPKPLLDAVAKLGYEIPSPIQMAAIPLGLQFRDVIGVAETGSGKTAAFVLPMLTYIMKQPVMTDEVSVDGPYSVVMAPTRELAQQIEEETVKLMQFTDFRAVSVVGGESIGDQGFKLRKGCEIIIATPGRLKDCLEQRYAVLNQCNYVVLDEADRMIDLGFEPQVVYVLDAMPSSNLRPEDEEVIEGDKIYRTTYMFSATMPPVVERLARKYMRRAVTINIGSAGKATDNVSQEVILCKDNEKTSMLTRQLQTLEDERRVIVFVNQKRGCDTVTKHLEQLGHHCTVLHSGKTQEQRVASLQGFRDERFNVLVATNVAARGLDVPDVAMVINYDMPGNIEDYTHRIGRTGRAGKKGRATTFLTQADTEVFYDLKRLLEESKATVPHWLSSHEAAKNKPGTISERPRRDQTVFANK